MTDLHNIQDPPDFWSKDKLIPTIMETVPIDFVLETVGLVRACYNTDKYVAWDEERLNNMSEYDLVRILQFAQITEDQIPKEE